MTRMSTLLNGLKAWPCVTCVTVAAAFLVSAGPAFAQDAGASSSGPVSRYSGRIASVQTAESALGEIGKARSGIEERFTADERACYSDFFANSCVDVAKERRRLALADVRKVEVEANAFLRQVRLNERDKVLEEKRLAQEQKDAERLKREQESGPAKKTNAAMRENSPDTPRAIESKRALEPVPDPAANPIRKPVPLQPSPKHGDAGQRQAQHEARLKELAERERAGAQRRAEKIAAYERKVRDSEERQRQVEEKKKEKERERASRTPAK